MPGREWPSQLGPALLHGPGIEGAATLPRCRDRGRGGVSPLGAGRQDEIRFSSPHSRRRAMAGCHASGGPGGDLRCEAVAIEEARKDASVGS